MSFSGTPLSSSSFAAPLILMQHQQFVVVLAEPAFHVAPYLLTDRQAASARLLDSARLFVVNEVGRHYYRECIIEAPAPLLQEQQNRHPAAYSETREKTEKREEDALRQLTPDTQLFIHHYYPGAASVHPSDPLRADRISQLFDEDKGQVPVAPALQRQKQRLVERCDIYRRTTDAEKHEDAEGAKKEKIFSSDWIELQVPDVDKKEEQVDENFNDGHLFCEVISISSVSWTRIAVLELYEFDDTERTALGNLLGVCQPTPVYAIGPIHQPAEKDRPAAPVPFSFFSAEQDGQQEQAQERRNRGDLEKSKAGDDERLVTSKQLPQQVTKGGGASKANRAERLALLKELVRSTRFQSLAAQMADTTTTTSTVNVQDLLS
jgi:hypothetical protein